jgi:predicted transcriptional regulator
MMAPRPTHIPHNVERTALQKMSPTRGLTAERLYPAGSQTIAGMVAKGWIEKQPDGRTYCITPAGNSALKAAIPIKR